MNITPYAFVFIATFISIIVFRPLSHWLGLVDIPSERKHHQGSIPLIGGLAMFIGVTLGLFSSGMMNIEENLVFFFLGSFVLVLTGMVDDFRGISSNNRFIFQILVALIIVKVGGVLIEDLGNLISVEKLHLESFSLVFTIFAIVGVVNSLNFSDGIDGMSASLSLITFISIAFFAISVKENYAFEFVLLFIVTIGAFLIFNLGLFMGSSFKIFMGDAGSTFLGLGISWALISFSQGDKAIFSPVTALWIFAVPLLDTIFVMIRRVSHGKSPFTPDREHLHHFFIRSGRTDRETLLIIVTFSAMMAFIGIVFELNDIPERLMFLLFVIISFIYLFVLRRAWKLINAKNIYIE
jgi:UDP-GlcNAc:undecaprenyl-phosphate/decaprenyl-phosphate GlcNAc-1-phosphate transferase